MGYPVQEPDATDADRHLAALPLFHITGLGLSLSMLQIGAANVVQETFDPANAVQMMDEHNVSLVAVFPPILSMLLDSRQTAGASWDSLKHVLGLDAPETIQRLYTETKGKFWTGFGQAETSGVVTLVRVDTKPGATGKPLPMVRLYRLTALMKERKASVVPLAVHGMQMKTVSI